MWSYLIAAIGITAMWLAGMEKTRRLGWELALLQQGVWMWYALTTEQYGFILGAAAATLVFARNLWRQENDRH